MITQLFDNSVSKVLCLYVVSPGSKFKRNELKQHTFLNNVPLDFALNKLINSEILIRKNNLYYFNFESEFGKSILEIHKKQYYKLKELPLNVYFSLLDIVERFSTTNTISLYLFGSFSKLIYTRTSDIDIAVIYKQEPDFKTINNYKEKIEKKYNKKIELHYFKKEEFEKNKNDPIIHDIVKNGEKLM